MARRHGTSSDRGTRGRGPLAHLPFALAAFVAILCGLFLGGLFGRLVPVLVASLPVAGALWAIVHYAFGGTRRSALAGPYLILLWTAVMGGALGAVGWREAMKAEARAEAAREALIRNAPKASAAKAKAALDPAVASQVVEAFIADIRAANAAFVRDVAAKGYTDAIGGGALSNPGSVTAAPERIAAARPLFEDARARQIRRTEEAASAVKMLPAQTEPQKLLLEEMQDELASNRAIRIAYWNAMMDSADALRAMAQVLARTQGSWTADLASRSIHFASDADAAAYEAEADRHRNAEARADRELNRLNRSADALRTMAKRWAE